MPTVPADEDALTRAIIALASEYGRYGYRRVTALLQAAGWQVGKDRVQRIWRREGLKVPQKHRPRSRLWLNDGSCVRLRPLHRNHVWSFDFVQAQTHDGRSLRILTLIDEHSRACLALKVARRINSVGVIEALADAMCLHGIPEHIRCDNGPEMISKALRKWVAKAGSQIQYIAPGSPWENGYCESFNGKLRDECLTPGDLLLAEGGADRDRSMAKHLQPRPTAFVAGLSAARARQLPGSGLPATHGRHHAVASQSARSKIPVRSIPRDARGQPWRATHSGASWVRTRVRRRSAAINADGSGSPNRTATSKPSATRSPMRSRTATSTDRSGYRCRNFPSCWASTKCLTVASVLIRRCPRTARADPSAQVAELAADGVSCVVSDRPEIDLRPALEVLASDLASAGCFWKAAPGTTPRS